MSVIDQLPVCFAFYVSFFLHFIFSVVEILLKSLKDMATDEVEDFKRDDTFDDDDDDDDTRHHNLIESSIRLTTLQIADEKYPGLSLTNQFVVYL